MGEICFPHILTAVCDMKCAQCVQYGCVGQAQAMDENMYVHIVVM